MLLSFRTLVLGPNPAKDTDVGSLRFWSIAFLPEIAGVPNKIKLYPFILFKFLLTRQRTKGNRINANPLSVLKDSGGTDKLLIFIRWERIRLDCDENLCLFKPVGQVRHKRSVDVIGYAR